MNKQLENHPAADLFPTFAGKPYEEFKEDLRTNGQLETIKLWDDKILDGRNRYRACQELGIDPRLEELPESIDPLRYVISANLHRRHLSESQRAMVAGKIANIKQGGTGANRYKKKSGISTESSIDDSVKISRQEASRLLNVSPESIDRARKVLRDGIPELVMMVEEDKLTVYAASKAAEMPKQEQKKLADQGPKMVKSRVTENRKKMRQSKNNSLGKNGTSNKIHQPGRKQGRPRKLPPEIQPLQDKAMGLVAELTEMGHWHQARMSPVAVSMIAQKLKRELTAFFDEIAAWLC